MQFIFNTKDNVINIIRKTVIMFFVLIIIFIFIEIIEFSFRGLSKDIKKNERKIKEEYMKIMRKNI